jgi:hypothetical protein
LFIFASVVLYMSVFEPRSGLDGPSLSTTKHPAVAWSLDTDIYDQAIDMGLAQKDPNAPAVEAKEEEAAYADDEEEEEQMEEEGVHEPLVPNFLGTFGKSVGGRVEGLLGKGALLKYVWHETLSGWSGLGEGRLVVVGEFWTE